MSSLLYKNPVVYEKVLSLVHRNNFSKRYNLMADLIGKRKKVLDLGCGSGVLTKYLDDSCSYFGIEANKRFAEHCQKKGLEVTHGNLFEVDFPQVDTVVISDVLHHILPNHKKLLAKAKKVSKTIIICEPKHKKGKISSFVGYNRYFFKLLGDYDGINDFETMAQWTFSETELKKLLSNFGQTKTYELGESIVAEVKLN